MIVEVHFHNHTPPAWQAVITGVAADFVHRDGGKSQDNNPNTNIPSGNGEAILYSANVECVTQFTAHMSVRDKTGKFQVISRTFKDPLGRPCVEEGQDVNLGQAGFELVVDRLGLKGNVEVFDISIEPHK